jgi:hypothetical protein
MSTNGESLRPNRTEEFDVDLPQLRLMYWTSIAFAVFALAVWAAYTLLLLIGPNAQGSLATAQKLAVGLTIWFPILLLLRIAASTRKTVVAVAREGEKVVFLLSSGTSVALPRSAVLQGSLTRTRLSRISGKGLSTEAAVLHIPPEALFIERSWLAKIRSIAGEGELGTRSSLV